MLLRGRLYGANFTSTLFLYLALLLGPVSVSESRWRNIFIESTSISLFFFSVCPAVPPPQKKPFKYESTVLPMKCTKHSWVQPQEKDAVCPVLSTIAGTDTLAPPTSRCASSSERICVQGKLCYNVKSFHDTSPAFSFCFIFELCFQEMKNLKVGRIIKDLGHSWRLLFHLIII